ncbi:MAG: efflux transporter outer membrane subunit [Opitutaceae bacterium]|nr:efflux transporter outer membrane subunit [Opitutaceae bacterium]
MRIHIPTLSACAGAILLAGCATKSPPSAQELRDQTGTLSTIVPADGWKGGATAGPVADNWLATFADPQLDALVAEALANNPDLKVAATRVEQAGEYVAIARGALWPTVGVYASGGENMGGGDALQMITVRASWEIDVWGRVRYGRNAAEASYQSVQADFAFARQSLAATVAKGWFTATETLLQIRIAEQMVAAAQELVNLAGKRHQVGIGTEQDVALARASLGDAQDSLMQVKLAHEQAKRALELLIGRYPAAELAARDSLLRVTTPIPAGLPLEMLERRPDLVAAERRVAVAFNRVGEAKAAMLPKISINANVANLASDILELKQDFQNPAGGIGASLLAPVFTGGQLQAQVRIRTLEQKEATADYARVALRALGDVENALAAAQTLRDREAVLERTLGDHRRALELAQTSYRIGTTDLRAVQQQQLRVQSAELALLRVRSEQLAQRANLHLALGGSFAAPVEVASASSSAP